MMDASVFALSNTGAYGFWNFWLMWLKSFKFYLSKI